MNPSVLKKLHETEIEILNEIDRICKKHHITYYLIGGTLLGAVRHKGFIPWDDDIDIAMPRADLETFFEVCTTELSDLFEVVNTNSDTYCRLFAKIQKKNTLCLEQDSLIYQNNCMNWGIFVDIFPLDNTKKGYGSRIQWEMAKRINHFIIRKIVIGAKCKSYKDEIMRVLLSLISTNFLKKCRDRLCKLYNHNKHCTHFINLGSPKKYGHELWLIDKWIPVVNVEFEGKMYPAPHDYDYVLKILYGDDYMQLPPPEKRVNHNIVKISFNIEQGHEEL